MVDVACDHCGRVVQRKPAEIAYYRRHYCSRQCHDDARRGITGAGTPGWRGGRIPRICAICGASFDVAPYSVRRGQGRYCSMRCMGIGQHETGSKRGANNGAWRGGTTPARRAWENLYGGDWQQRVRERDGCHCRLCGKQSNPPDVHHIMSWAEFPRYRQMTRNGLVLCGECHRVFLHSKAGAELREQLEAAFLLSGGMDAIYRVVQNGGQ